MAIIQILKNPYNVVNTTQQRQIFNISIRSFQLLKYKWVVYHHIALHIPQAYKAMKHASTSFSTCYPNINTNNFANGEKK